MGALFVIGLFLCSCAPRSILDLRSNTPWIAPDTATSCSGWFPAQSVKLPEYFEPSLLFEYSKRIPVGVHQPRFELISSFDPCGKPKSPPTIGLIVSQAPADPNRQYFTDAEKSSLFVPDTLFFTLRPGIINHPEPGQPSIDPLLKVLQINGAGLPFFRNGDYDQRFLASNWPSGKARKATLEIALKIGNQWVAEIIDLDMDTHRFHPSETCP